MSNKLFKISIIEDLINNKDEYMNREYELLNISNKKEISFRYNSIVSDYIERLENAIKYYRKIKNLLIVDKLEEYKLRLNETIDNKINISKSRTIGGIGSSDEDDEYSDDDQDYEDSDDDDDDDIKEDGTIIKVLKTLKRILINSSNNNNKKYNSKLIDYLNKKGINNINLIIQFIEDFKQNDSEYNDKIDNNITYKEEFKKKIIIYYINKYYEKSDINERNNIIKNYINIFGLDVFKKNSRKNIINVQNFKLDLINYILENEFNDYTNTKKYNILDIILKNFNNIKFEIIKNDEQKKYFIIYLINNTKNINNINEANEIIKQFLTLTNEDKEYIYKQISKSKLNNFKTKVEKYINGEYNPFKFTINLDDFSNSQKNIINDSNIIEFINNNNFIEIEKLLNSSRFNKDLIDKLFKNNKIILLEITKSKIEITEEEKIKIEKYYLDLFENKDYKNIIRLIRIIIRNPEIFDKEKIKKDIRLKDNKIEYKYQYENENKLIIKKILEKRKDIYEGIIREIGILEDIDEIKLSKSNKKIINERIEDKFRIINEIINSSIYETPILDILAIYEQSESVYKDIIIEYYKELIKKYIIEKDNEFKLNYRYNSFLYKGLKLKPIEDKIYIKEENKEEKRKLIINKFRKFFNPNEIINNNTIEYDKSIIDIEYYINDAICSLFIYYQTDGDFRFNDLDNIKLKSYYVNYDNINNEYVINNNSSVDVGGVRRDFINALCNELFSKGILIKDYSNERYYLNANYKPNEVFSFLINKKIDKKSFEEYNEDFYKFLGLLISFILVNKCGLKYRISYGLLSLFKYEIKEMDDEDYIKLMKIDNPIFENRLKYGDQDYSYNDELYKINKRSSKKDDYQEYIKSLARHLMTRNIQTKKDIREELIERQTNSENNKEGKRIPTEAELKKMGLEMKNIRMPELKYNKVLSVLERRGQTVVDIEKLREKYMTSIINSNLSNKKKTTVLKRKKEDIEEIPNIQELKEDVEKTRIPISTKRDNSQELLENQSQENNNSNKTNRRNIDREYTIISDNGKRIYEYFNEGIPKYIKLYTRERDISLKEIDDIIIAEEITEEIIKKLIDNVRRNTRDTELVEEFINTFLIKKRTNKKEIIKKLLIFWSGVPYYMEDKTYKLNVLEFMNIDRLPQSHTCFCIIDYPRQKEGEIKYELEKKTMIAIQSNSTLDYA